MNLMRTPKSVDISVTNRCNLRCKYCSHFTSPGDVNSDLPAEEWLDFFKELNQAAVLDVTLQGGEPFARKDLRRLIEGIIKNRMRFSILSNGTLISDDDAAFLAETKRCNYVQVSIDGSKPETHDVCRGNGNFNKAVNGLKTLQRYKVPVAVRVTIHHHNVWDLEDIAKLLLEDVGLGGFYTNSASHLGMCRENADGVQLSIEERRHAMETLLMLKQKYRGRISANAGPLAEAETWLDMEQARVEKRDPMPGRGRLKGCGGVFSKLSVRSDGAMVPCIQMSHIELGRINRDSLVDVWQNHPQLIRLRERRDVPLGEFEFCKGCSYIPYCTGNCPALAYTMTGMENHPSPDACLKLYLNEGGILPHVN